MNLSKHHIVLCSTIALLLFNFVLFQHHFFYWYINGALLFIQILLIIIGVSSYRFNYFISSIHSGKEKGVSLTFDDGINAQFTPKILSILKEKNVSATFFIIGKNIKGNENLLHQIHTDKHLIGNHSFYHQNWFNSKCVQYIVEEIEKTDQAIENIIQKKVRFFRTPFGAATPNVAKALKQTQHLSIGWDFRSYDTVAKNSKDLLQKMIAKAHSSSIILLHDNNSFTTEALPLFIDYCKKNGIKIVPLDQMIHQKAYK